MTFLHNFSTQFSFPGLLVALMAICLASCQAQPANADSLNDLLFELELAKMNALMKFIEENPESEELDDAYSMTFKLANNLNEEEAAVPLAKKYLEGDGVIAEAKANAVIIYALIKKGEIEAAADRFTSMVQFGARRDPNTVGSCGFHLADEAQIALKPEVAKEVLAAMVERLPLLPSFSNICKQKITKLDWVNKPALEITVSDLDENPIKIEDYEGKVLLIDFWGTFCQPCIAEFPGLKKLYSEFHDQGFEIVGISLDDSQTSVEVFQEQHELPWTLSMGLTDDNATIDRYDGTPIPSTCLIGPDGNVIAVDLRGGALRKAIRAQFEK